MPRAASRNAELRAAARAKILEGSIEAFSRKGFHAATMDDVAASAGVSKGLAYFYFRSKDELLVRALRERVEHLFEIGEALDRKSAPEKRLAALVGMLFAKIREDPDAFRLYLVLSLDKSVSAAGRRAVQGLQARLGRYLAAARGIFEDLGSPDPDLDALLFRSTLLGVFLRYVRAIEDVPIERLSDRVVELMRARAVPVARR